jgi:hypothetical protein
MNYETSIASPIGGQSEYTFDENGSSTSAAGSSLPSSP